MEEPPRLPRPFTLIPKTPAEPTLDPSLLVPAQMTYRSTGLGFYAIAVRCCTMPLEKLAMIMNSAQVRRASHPCFTRTHNLTLSPTRTLTLL